MKKLLFIPVTALVLFTASCKLDAPILPKKTDTTSTKGGTTSGTTVSTTDTYQPVTKGSYWKTVSTLAPGITSTATMSGETETINGKIYYAVNSTASGSTDTYKSYYYHGNDIYLLRSTTLVANITVDFLYLKDNYTIGKTWTTPVTDDGLVNGVPGQIVGKIVEQGITKTVGGKNFTNVIHTQLRLQYDIGSGFEDTETFDFYIAKNVGIIQVDANIPAANIISSSTLTDYSIK